MWNLVDRKDVRDADGFWTEYTLYVNEDETQWVCVFGDSDLYTPDNHYTDAEFETEEEAYEWFEYYEGFEDEDDGWDRWEVESSRDDWDMDEDYYSVNLAF